MILRSLASRALLRPSRHDLPCRKEEVMMEAPWGKVQAWREYSHGAGGDATRAYFLRFLGSRGRAEHATLDPADRLGALPSEVWTVNPPGFGRTSGPLDLERYADSAQLAMRHLLAHAGGRPVWVCGKSIGTTAAMLAAAEGAAGLIVRNVLPLHALLRERYAWRTGGTSRLLASAIPERLDAIANARRARCPGLFIVSRDDAVSPSSFQHRVIAAFVGGSTVLEVAGGHDDRALESRDEERYRQVVTTFAGRCLTPSASRIS